MFFIIVCLASSIQAVVAQERGDPATLAEREIVANPSARTVPAPSGRLPEGFWKMPPKTAALALVEANRTPEHRRKYDLRVDGFHPPAWGWFVVDFDANSSQASANSLFALRFGSTRPYLFQAVSNRNGALGTEQWPNQSGLELRLIDVSVDEARFLVQVLFWLDQMRTGAAKGGSIEESPVDSTADGTLASRWSGEYDREAFHRFADFLLNQELPRHMGERWKIAAPRIRHAGPLPDVPLTTGYGDNRDELSLIVLIALRRHRVTSWPASALREVVECAGEAGLVRTLPALEDLERALPPVRAEEREFRMLEEERLKGWEPGNPEQAKQQKRHAALAKKFAFYLPVQIRPTLERALRQLRALDPPVKSMNLAFEAAAFEAEDEPELAKTRTPALLKVPKGDSGSSVGIGANR